MPRHDLDVISLVAGILFVVIAAALFLEDVVDVGVDARWLGPLVLIGLGAAGLAASLRRQSR